MRYNLALEGNKAQVLKSFGEESRVDIKDEDEQKTQYLYKIIGRSWPNRVILTSYPRS